MLREQEFNAVSVATRVSTGGLGHPLDVLRAACLCVSGVETVPLSSKDYRFPAQNSISSVGRVQDWNRQHATTLTFYSPPMEEALCCLKTPVQK